MKANNLTICIDAKCNKNCHYCVSKMTWNPIIDNNLFERNIKKAVKLAELASVSSVLLTSKGEPLLNKKKISFCSYYFNKFPLEIQTNGLLLDKNHINWLYNNGINTIAISIDNSENVNIFKNIYDYYNKLGINIRLTIILTDFWCVNDALEFIIKCKELGIKQIIICKVTIPTKVTETLDCANTIKWIKDNTACDHKDFLKTFRQAMTPERLIRNLPFGTSVYTINGIAFTIMDYCIQENNNTEDIRSLIYHQDGHMYTSWDKQGSILF